MINFSRDPDKYQAVGAFMARVGGISDEMDLFCRLSEALHFPENAGGGWNGIDDELRDLSWIAEKEVVIVHTEYFQVEAYFPLYFVSFFCRNIICKNIYFCQRHFYLEMNKFCASYS